MPYPTKPKGGWQCPRQVVSNKSTAQLREKKATQKFANKNKDIFQKTPNMVEGHRDPQGPYFYQEGGKTYASLPLEMIQGIQQSLLFEKMRKDCATEGKDTEGNNGQRPQDPCIDTTRLPQEYRSWDNASNVQPQRFERDGREGRSR